MLKTYLKIIKFVIKLRMEVIYWNKQKSKKNSKDQEKFRKIENQKIKLWQV